MDSLVGTFRITQPGSSVATSLCEGEAVPKHTGLVEIRGSGIRMLKLPLSQVGREEEKKERAIGVSPFRYNLSPL